MFTLNLDLIRFILDGAIVLCCVVLIIRIRRQPGPSRSPAAPSASRPAGQGRSGIGAPPNGPRSSDLTPAEPLSSPGALKAEVLRLTRLGLNVTEIARRTGLAKSEVALIQKFPSQT